MMTAPSAAEAAAAANAPSAAEVEAARKRGKANWGLPKAVGRVSIPLTRPVRVACYTDKLVLIPERTDDRYPTEFAIEGDVRRAVDGFVVSLWRYMEGWGIAGASMYWKPVLSVQVMPGAEERFTQLQGLLEGSGIVVERVQP